MSNESLMREIARPEHRSDPYQLYARLRGSPVTKQDDGSYVVSTYPDITALLHDPRISSDAGNLPEPPAVRAAVPPFIVHDPPSHDELRRLAMRHFGPPGSPGLVNGVEPEIRDMLDRLLSDLDASAPVDVVDAYAYPLPVTVICRILGVPAADQENFHAWADAIVADIDSSAQADAAQLDERRKEAQSGVAGYVGNLLQQFRSEPSDTLLSHLANDPESDRMSDIDMVVTAVLLLIAGHETTVNLISNGVLTLLRHPEHLAHLREDPELAVPLVEELLRFEPPIQYLPQRSTVDDIEVGATTIPKGSRIVLLLAAGSRDPQQFTDPDRFVPGRSDNQHFGFGGGIHYCFGAPLARLEAQLALAEFARRVSNPRLVADPPPYRPSPVLRGPQHLLVEMDGVNAV